MHSQVRLPSLISDGMVLQRDSKLKIWGWASPGEKVQLSFNNKRYSTVTATNGKWVVELPPVKAGGPYTMEISASNHISLGNILVGDVWLCSGQSNMVVPMDRLTEKYPEDVAGANYPQIRNFFIPTVSDGAGPHDAPPPGKWVAADPQTVLSFGAVSYYFARQLYNKYHVPIGIINSSVGGTPIEAWISEEGLKAFPAALQTIQHIKDTAYTDSMNRLVAMAAARNAQNQSMANDKGLNGAKKWFDTSYIADDWHTMRVPGYWADQGIRGLNGVVWYRKEIVIPADLAGKPARLFLGRIVDADIAYINGVKTGATTYQYPPRRYTVPTGLLHAGRNTIVVRIVNTVGKGGFVPDKPYYLALGDQRIDLQGDWQYKVGDAYKPLPFIAGSDFSMQNQPTSLYNTMIAPLVNYAIKGFVWYQGEANTNHPYEYRRLLPALIADWRHQWRQDNLPFLYPQLPNYMEVQYLPSESQWAVLRESQLQALSVPNTAMAVTIDAGEWNDIHPLNKKDPGERLALAAEKIAYGEAEVVASGPIYQSALVAENKIVVSFSNTGSGLMVKGGNTLTQFAIAGADKKFVWANAVIKDNKVIVWNDAIPHPVYVRYAWADNPEGANLCNMEGLPASPFRTDGE